MRQLAAGEPQRLRWTAAYRWARDQPPGLQLRGLFFQQEGFQPTTGWLCNITVPLLPTRTWKESRELAVYFTDASFVEFLKWLDDVWTDLEYPDEPFHYHTDAPFQYQG